ncbi:MAG: cytochrome c biogenesis protein CcdA [Roseiflexaceae bacterium]|nr:cytochrome c biogenesis protein CcdA [Roseiflexaceae bacterium]
MSTDSSIHTSPFWRIASIGAGVLLVLLVLVLLSAGGGSNLSGSGSLLVYAPAAFLAGVFSFLSPCTLPILPAYFAFTFQARRERIVAMTVAFFLGLATTMVVIGSISTAFSQVLRYNMAQFAQIGGLLVIAFGVMSFFGKGFTGVKLMDRPAASIAGSYFYGATFALGWSACVGPILGALFTLLAVGGVGMAQGAVLSFIYALGLGAPLIIVASYFSKLGRGSAFWNLMRGKAFELNLGSTTLHLHTTSMASGLLLIMMGLLLATGQMVLISQWASQTPMASWAYQIEKWIAGIFVR